MSVLLAYKIVWAQICFFERAQGNPSSEGIFCTLYCKTEHTWCYTKHLLKQDGAKLFSSVLNSFHGACQCLVHIQHWDVWVILMFVLGQLPSSFVVEQPYYLKNRIIFEMAY